MATILSRPSKAAIRNASTTIAKAKEVARPIIAKPDALRTPHDLDELCRTADALEAHVRDFAPQTAIGSSLRTMRAVLLMEAGEVEHSLRYAGECISQGLLPGQAGQLQSLAHHASMKEVEAMLRRTKDAHCPLPDRVALEAGAMRKLRTIALQSDADAREHNEPHVLVSYWRLVSRIMQDKLLHDAEQECGEDVDVHRSRGLLSREIRELLTTFPDAIDTASDVELRFHVANYNEFSRLVPEGYSDVRVALSARADAARQLSNQLFLGEVPQVAAIGEHSDTSTTTQANSFWKAVGTQLAVKCVGGIIGLGVLGWLVWLGFGGADLLPLLKAVLGTALGNAHAFARTAADLSACLDGHTGGI